LRERGRWLIVWPVESSLDGSGPEATSGPEALETKIDLRAYWRVVRKRWPFVALSTILGVAGAFVYTYRQPKIYEASCQIVIEATAPQVLQVKDAIEMGSGTMFASKEFFETQYRIIQSSAVAQRVADKLGLAHDPDYSGLVGRGSNADGLNLARALSRQVSVKPIKDTRVSQIVVQDHKPERAAILANMFAETYIESNLDYKLEGSRAANAWLSEQEVELRKKLEDSELALFKFKKDRGLLDINLGQKQNMTEQILTSLNEKLAAIRIKRLELESTRQLVQAAHDEADKESVPAVEGMDSLQEMRSHFLIYAKEKADLAGKYGPEHPRIKIIDAQMEAVSKAYQHEIETNLRIFENKYQALISTEKSLLTMMDKEKLNAIELSKLGVEYKPYERTAEENAKVYELIARRQKEIDLTGLLRSNNVRILERAITPGSPASPKPMQNLLIALMCGFSLGIGLAFAIELLDNTLKTQIDVETFLGVPVLGLIPIIGQGKLDAKGKDKEGKTDEQVRDRDLGIFREPRSMAAECCRSIRTNILFMSPDHPIRTMVITSPSPQEGKTTTAINLAVAMAEAGGRVLLIDTDMRRPRLHRSFAVPNQVGVSTLILGNSKLDDAIKHTDVPNLDLLPCGPIPPNPSELLHTKRFAQILEDCKTRYERIILDSPPTSAVTDPAVLGNLADGVILIVKGASTTREAAAHARRQLISAKCRLLGVIVNEIDFSNPGYGYHYYYYRKYSRYGYTYGGDPTPDGPTAGA
jgi:succinoglycan biosynthesis transport protein ExoP